MTRTRVPGSAGAGLFIIPVVLGLGVLAVAVLALTGGGGGGGASTAPVAQTAAAVEEVEEVEEVEAPTTTAAAAEDDYLSERLAAAEAELDRARRRGRLLAEMALEQGRGWSLGLRDTYIERGVITEGTITPFEACDGRRWQAIEDGMTAERAGLLADACAVGYAVGREHDPMSVDDVEDELGARIDRAARR